MSSYLWCTRWINDINWPQGKIKLQNWISFYITVYGSFQGFYFDFPGLFFAFRGVKSSRAPCNFSLTLGYRENYLLFLSFFFFFFFLLNFGLNSAKCFCRRYDECSKAILVYKFLAQNSLAALKQENKNWQQYALYERHTKLSHLLLAITRWCHPTEYPGVMRGASNREELTYQ